MAVAVPADEKATFTLTSTAPTGESVDIKVIYPKGRGMSAIHALQSVSQTKNMVGLMSILRKDPQVAAHMAEKGIAFDDDDEDESAYLSEEDLDLDDEEDDDRG